MADFEIRQNDHGRTFEVEFADANGVVELPTNTTLQFEMRHRARRVVTGGAANLGSVGAAPGGAAYANNKGSYVMTATDTKIVGIYDARFIATTPSGQVYSFPTRAGDADGLVVEVCPLVSSVV
jgi:hypothetical protein